MTILADHQIIKLARAGMIEPFVGQQVRAEASGKVISYGLSSYGYDARLGSELRLAMPPLDGDQPLDPKAPSADYFWTTTDPTLPFILQSGGFVLGHTLEYFRMPANVTGVVWGKSTYARAGVNVVCTPLEAGWEGQITLEIVNNGPWPVRLYLGEGICQVTFHEGEPCNVPYNASRKYQGQQGVTLGRV